MVLESWTTSDSLPCMISEARTTRAPKAAPMHWWPRHTPRIGMRGANRRITSHETPASLGVQGPGETTMRCGRIASMASGVIRSFNATRVSAPSSPR